MLEDEFSDIIKKARTGLGLGLEEESKRSGLDLAVVRELDAGRRTPSPREVSALASALELDGEKLISLACEGWEPAPHDHALDDAVITIHGNIGGYAVKGYLFHDAQTRDAVMIDTAYDARAMLETLSRQALRLTAVCLTHGHVDHAGGLDAILARHPVPVYIGEDDWPLLHWKPPASLRRFVKDGDRIAAGGRDLRFLTTPGHTPGGVCYAAADCVFVGDTLFAGSIGRANPASLYPIHLNSVRQRLLTLPDRIALLPGHGPGTTVLEEKAHNPFG
jgi:hydroxyacylglutathione hydrolase